VASADSYLLRRAAADDVGLVFLWRNDPVTREASFDTAEKTRDSFVPAYEHWRESDPIAPQLVEFAGESVAFLRFSEPRDTSVTDNATVEISIHVAPGARRRGHGRAALAHAAQFAKENGWRKLLALVKASNEVSQRLFSAAGYQEHGAIEVKPGEFVKIFVLDL
jgi:L-amino acid N-acyltransferase YncA